MCSHRVVRRETCLYFFDVLHNPLKKMDPPKPPTTFPNSSYPLFVIWIHGRDDSLRGCVGTFTALNIHHGLREYAITSALKDSRFSPITEEEFPHLTSSALRQSIRLTRYRSEKLSVPASDYLRARQNGYVV
ncbi:unnamed protein product [Echinostoma caproni]|uniref:AMMECR1 domain-containing protein n=1 Tax=Echinostoma caproni TaxID=27848 RepID=A0A183B2W4_9TREM|nr:unnamed protein product [Echinostoma caproni]